MALIGEASSDEAEYWSLVLAIGGLVVSTDVACCSDVAGAFTADTASWCLISDDAPSLSIGYAVEEE